MPSQTRSLGPYSVVFALNSMDSSKSSVKGDPATPSQRLTYTPGMELNVDMNLDGFKVVDLQSLLKERDLPTVGKKADLIARLKEAINFEAAVQGSPTSEHFASIRECSPRTVKNASERGPSPKPVLVKDPSPKAGSVTNSPRPASVRSPSPKPASVRKSSNMSDRTPSVARSEVRRASSVTPVGGSPRPPRSASPSKAGIPSLNFAGQSGGSPRVRSMSETPRSVKNVSMQGGTSPRSNVNGHIELLGEDVPMAVESSERKRTRERGNHGWDQRSEGSQKEIKKIRSTEPETDRKLHVKVSEIDRFLLFDTSFFFRD